MTLAVIMDIPDELLGQRIGIECTADEDPEVVLRRFDTAVAGLRFTLRSRLINKDLDRQVGPRVKATNEQNVS